MQPGGWEIESPTFPAKISRDLRRAGPPSGRSGKRGESSSFVTEPFFEVGVASFVTEPFFEVGVATFVTEPFFEVGVASFVTEPFFGMGSFVTD